MLKRCIFIFSTVFAMMIAMASVVNATDFGDSTPFNKKEAEIKKQSIYTAKIAPVANKGYSGKRITPTITVTLNGKKLQKGVDYKVSYNNNLNIGTASITATGINSYYGTVSTSFRIVTPVVKKVTGLKSMSGCNKVKLKWKKSPGADHYLIMKSGQSWGQNGWPKSVKKCTWEDKNAKTYKKYTYRVYAAKNIRNVETHRLDEFKSSSSVKKAQSVRKLRMYLRVRGGRSLRSHDGSHKHVYVYSGEKIISDGYGSGCYYFKKKGHTYRILNRGVSKTKADYSKSKDYSKDESEYFINKYYSPHRTYRNKLIWVSTYTQQIHIFKKSNGKWKQIKCWDVSTGKLRSPSPTGIKTIHKKISSRHGIPYWSCYSTLNAIHGVKWNWGSLLGRIASGGCVRNTVSHAKWIYHNCPIGTKVIMY